MSASMTRAQRAGLTMGNLRHLSRENRLLRAALHALLEEMEATALVSSWPAGAGEPRLCKILAVAMRDDDDDFGVNDLKLIKQARRALGLPEWWRE